jgi:PAS domain S-box-containing protein
MERDIEDRKLAEEVLRESEKSVRLIVDGIPGLVAITTPEGKVEFVNNQALEYFGKTLEELKGWATSDAVHSDDLPQAVAAWRHSVETGDPYDVDHRLRRADGAYRWFHSRGLPLRDTDGRIVRWYNLLTDIDERRRAEEKLPRSEAYFSAAQKLSHTGSFGWDVSTGDIYSSPETFRIFEYEPITKVTVELALQRTHPEDRSAVEQLIERISRERAEFDFEYRLLMPDGSVKYLRIVGRPSADESGRLEFVGAVTDVTAAKQAEMKLRRSEECLLETQSLTHTGSWRHNLLSGEVTVSPEVYRIYGVRPDEDTSNTEFWLNRNHPEDAKRIQELFERSEIEKTDYEADYRIVLPDGTIKHLHAIGHPILNELGNLIEFVGTSNGRHRRKAGGREDPAKRKGTPTAP